MFVYEAFNLQHFDPDELMHVLNDSETEHRVLAGGMHNVQLKKLTIGDLDITSCEYSFSVLARTATRNNNMVYLGVPGRFFDGVRVNKQLTSQDQILLYAPGCEIHYSAPALSSWYMFQYPLDKIQKMAINQLGVDLEWPLQGLRHVDIPRKIADEIRKEVQELLQICTHFSRVSEVGLFESVISDRLVQLLIQAIARGSPSRQRKLSVGRGDALDQLERYIDCWLQDPDCSFQLSEIEGICQRMLERGTQEVYGITPHRWIKLARLNAAYHGLCDGKAVTDVCARWGFGNMGRFAQEYRMLFGELPKETLRQI